jgi:phage tail-like protein
MASGNRRDPLPVFCFWVQIDALGKSDADKVFFKSVSGLKVEHEVIPVRAGGVNDTTFQLVGGMKWGPLVLKQGFTNGSKLIEWREAWTTGKMTRSGGTITQLDTAMQARAQWTFFNAWPSKWEIGELDASKSELAIETLELSHEGLKYELLGPRT